MEIIVKDNIKEFTRWLDEIHKKQIPFATSRALNDTAVDVQEAEVSVVKRVFRSLKTWWLKQQPTGIKVKFSNKQNLHARVFTDAYFAEIQEKGGTKKPRRARNLAIPTEKVPKKYRTSHGAKEMIEQRNKVFATPKGVFRRTGKRTIQLLWSLSPVAIIKPRFPFHETAEQIALRRFNVHFPERLKQAIATAKPPSPPSS